MITHRLLQGDRQMRTATAIARSAARSSVCRGSMSALAAGGRWARRGGRHREPGARQAGTAPLIVAPRPGTRYPRTTLDGDLMCGLRHTTAPVELGGDRGARGRGLRGPCAASAGLTPTSSEFSTSGRSLPIHQIASWLRATLAEDSGQHVVVGADAIRGHHEERFGPGVTGAFPPPVAPAGFSDDGFVGDVDVCR